MPYGSSPYIRQRLVGVTGPTGSTGPTGNIGRTGPTGNPGSIGNTGIGISGMTLEGSEIKTTFNDSSLPVYGPRIKGPSGNYYINPSADNLISNNGITLFTGSTFNENILQKTITFRGITTASQNSNLRFISINTNPNTNVVEIDYNVTGLPYLGVSGGITGNIVAHTSGNYFHGITESNYDVDKQTFDIQLVNYTERVHFVRPIRKDIVNDDATEFCPATTTSCYFYWPIDYEKASTFVLSPINDQIQGLTPVAQVVLIRNPPSSDYSKAVTIVVPPSVTGGVLTKFANAGYNGFTGFTLEQGNYSVSWPLSYAPCFTEETDVINMVSLDNIWYANYGIYESEISQVTWNSSYNQCAGSQNPGDPTYSGYCCQPCDAGNYGLRQTTDIECRNLGDNYIFFYSLATAIAGCCGDNPSLGVCCYENGSEIQKVGNVRPCDCQRIAQGGWHRWTAYSSAVPNDTAINCSALKLNLGSCCDGNGSCTSLKTETECSQANHYWQGAGSVCQYVIGDLLFDKCASGTGGCCVSTIFNADCSIKTYQDCSASSGKFYGRGTTCSGILNESYPSCIPNAIKIDCCTPLGCQTLMSTQCVGAYNYPIMSGNCDAECVPANPLVGCCRPQGCVADVYLANCISSGGFQVDDCYSQCVKINCCVQNSSGTFNCTPNITREACFLLNGQEVSSCTNCGDSTPTLPCDSGGLIFDPPIEQSQCCNDGINFESVGNPINGVVGKMKVKPGDYFAGGIVVGVFNSNNSQCFGNTAFGGLPDWYSPTNATVADNEKLFNFLNSGEEKGCDFYRTVRDLRGYGVRPCDTNDQWLLIVSPINVRVESSALKKINGSDINSTTAIDQYRAAFSPIFNTSPVLSPYLTTSQSFNFSSQSSSSASNFDLRTAARFFRPFKTKIHMGVSEDGVEEIGYNQFVSQTEFTPFDDLPEYELNYNSLNLTYAYRNTQKFVWSHGGTAYAPILPHFRDDTQVPGGLVTNLYSTGLNTNYGVFRIENVYNPIYQTYYYNCTLSRHPLSAEDNTANPNPTNHKGEGFYGTLPGVVRNSIPGLSYFGNSVMFDVCADTSTCTQEECNFNAKVRAFSNGEYYALTSSTGLWSRNWGIHNSCRLASSEMIYYYAGFTHDGLNTEQSARIYNDNQGPQYPEYHNIYRSYGASGSELKNVTINNIIDSPKTETFDASFYHDGSDPSSIKTTISEALSVMNRHYYPYELFHGGFMNGLSAENASGSLFNFNPAFFNISPWYVPSADELAYIAKACLDPSFNLQQKILDWKLTEDKTNPENILVTNDGRQYKGVPIGDSSIDADGWVWTSTGSFDEGITAQYIQAVGGLPERNNADTSKFTKAWAMKFPIFENDSCYLNKRNDFRVKKADDHNDRYEVRPVRLVRCGSYGPNTTQITNDNTSLNFEQFGYAKYDTKLAHNTWVVPKLTDSIIVNGTSTAFFNDFSTLTDLPWHKRWTKYFHNFQVGLFFQDLAIYNGKYNLPPSSTTITQISLDLNPDITRPDI